MAMKSGAVSNVWVTIQALLYVGIGLLLAGWPIIVYPAFVLNGRLLEASLVRMLGACLAGFGLLLGAQQSQPRGRLLVLAANGWALAIAFIQQTAIWDNPWGWVIVAGLLLLTLGSAVDWWQAGRISPDWQRPQTAVAYLVALNAALLLLAGAALTLSPLGGVIGRGLAPEPTGFEILALTRVIGAALSGAGLLALTTFMTPNTPIWKALLAGNLLAFWVASIQQLTIWTNLPGFLTAAMHGALAALLALAWLWDAGGKGRLLPRLTAFWQTTAVSLAVYLSGTFLLVAAAAVYVHKQLGQIDALARWVMVLETAVLLGLLLTAPLQHLISRVGQTLAQLARQQPALAPAPRWPLTGLLTQLGQLVTHVQQSTQIRGQLRQQIRDATAQEERNRLARDLHDSIKQQLFAINVSAAAAQARWEHDPAGAQAALADVRGSAQAAMVEMNAMLQQLRPSPLENVGLVQALQEQCEALALRTGAAVTTEFCELPPPDWWPAGGQTAVFRIAQEALANVARHARATKVRVRLALSGDEKTAVLQLRIVDNGSGFDPAAVSAGMGLENMRARAQAIGAVFSVSGKAGAGITVSLDVPLLPQNLSPQPGDTALVELNRMLRNGAISAGVFALTYAVVSTANVTERPFLFTMLLSLLVGLVSVSVLVNYQLRRLPVSAAALALQGRSHGLRAAALLGMFLVVLSLPLALPWWESAVIVSLPAAIATMMAIGNTGARLYQTVQKRYHLLPPVEQASLQQRVNQWRQLGWMITAVLLINCSVSLFFIRPSLPPLTGQQWLQSVLITVTLAAVAVQGGVTRLRAGWAQPTSAKKETDHG